jgi:hypothetical protein
MTNVMTKLYNLRRCDSSLHATEVFVTEKLRHLIRMTLLPQLHLGAYYIALFFTLHKQEKYNRPCKYFLLCTVLEFWTIYGG